MNGSKKPPVGFTARPAAWLKRLLSAGGFACHSITTI
jgi:hypothetical protein